MTNKNTELLKIAQKHIGQGGAVFRKFCGLPAGAAWCNAFVDYIANEGGVSALYFDGKKETYCPNSIKWCKKNLAQIPLYLALPMDIIYFDWDKNGVPNHIGFVRGKNTTSSIYTIEGNTDGGKVAQKTRAAKYICGIYRPHLKGSYTLGQIKVDGEFGYNSIANFQKAIGGITVDGILGINTIKRLQQYVAVPQDGAFGPTTARATQKMLKANGYYKGSIDGEFGPASVRALQSWTNDKNKAVKKKTNADKLVDQMDRLAWKYGTAKSKYAYSTGAPTSACKTAMKKYGYNNKGEYSDCGDFVNTVVRESGLDKSFIVQRSVKAAFPAPGNHFSIVLKGKRIPAGFLKPGDIIRYKKKSGRGQHAMFYYGSGKVCDAGHYSRFANIRKDEKRYHNSNVKISTIQVLRAKG